MRLAFALVLCVSVSAHARNQPAIDAVQVARTTLERLTKNDATALVSSFDETMRTALPEEKVRGLWQTITSQAGALVKSGEPRLTAKGDLHIVVIPLTFEKIAATLQVVVDAAGQIAGLNVRPGAAAPAAFTDAGYVRADAFSEREVTVDAGGWPLPATLAMPSGGKDVPAVVLVHGSGPADRDATLGPNKPFRDLARGLASRSIATLRYEKRTRQHGAKLAALQQFTVKEETVDDAVAAVRLLQKTGGIDPERVYVLGHSLGGMLAPRIAMAAADDVAGLIVLAGAVRSLEQSMLDQSRYIAQSDGVISPEEQKQIGELEGLVARIKTLKPSDAPVGILGASAPASYWIDLRGYNPPAAAAKLAIPMLVLQGERDYQVTLEDFAQWKAALRTRKDVVFESYPQLNHLFIAGSGPSTPAEYLRPGHVAEEVVRDIAGWIVARKR
jgi:dienelactone hydrolase